MKRIIFGFILFSLIFTTNNLGQTEKGILRGLVKDASTGEVLAYCNALIKELNIGASTDGRGYFIITNIPADKKYTLQVGYIGYETKNISFNVFANKTLHLDIQLQPQDILLQTVEKVGKKVQESNAIDLGLQKITVKQLESLPSGVETDLFRALQYIPGVRSRGDISAKFYVRGSASNQNLILLNGSTIYNPFHALGIFSVIDPEIINSVEFFKGGFTPEFGGRMSSVLKVITKDGNRNRFSGMAQASLLTGKLLVEGPVFDNGSFMVTSRKTISNKIMEKFLNEQSIPIDFYDVNAKVNFEKPLGIEGSKLTFTGFLSGDNLKYKDVKKEDYKWSNSLIGMRWFQIGDVPLFFDIGISYSQFKGEIIPNLSSVKLKYNEINDLTIDANYNYVYDSKNELGVGLELRDLKTELYLENNRAAQTNLSMNGTSMALYAHFKFLQFDNIGLDLGGRFHLVRFINKENNISPFEPRINLTLQPFPFVKFKVSAGIYQQDVTTLENENEILNIFEPWIILPEYLKTQYSKQLSGGVELNLSPELRLEVETYVKKMENLAITNYDKKFSEDPDLVSGKGDASGIETALNFNNSFMNLSLSYTYAFAYKVYNNWTYYPGYDVRHSFNSSLEVEWGGGWSSSIVWTYNSGLPYTQQIGYYSKLGFTDQYLNELYNYFFPYSILDDLNLGRLPDYHRMDISVTKKLKIGLLESEIDLNLINVYNRKNIFYFKRETGQRVNMLPFLPTVTVKVKI